MERLLVFRSKRTPRALPRAQPHAQPRASTRPRSHSNVLQKKKKNDTPLPGELHHCGNRPSSQHLSKRLAHLFFRGSTAIHQNIAQSQDTAQHSDKAKQNKKTKTLLPFSEWQSANLPHRPQQSGSQCHEPCHRVRTCLSSDSIGQRPQFHTYTDLLSHARRIFPGVSVHNSGSRVWNSNLYRGESQLPGPPAQFYPQRNNGMPLLERKREVLSQAS